MAEERAIALPPGVEWPEPPSRGPIEGRGMIVNETDLPDEAVKTYIEENASVLGVNAGSTFQNYANQGSMLARSKYRTPSNVIEEICLARDLAERDDDVAPTMGSMLAMAFGDGMQHTHPDDITLAVFDEVASNMNLDQRWLELYREWLISGQLNTVTAFTREEFHFTPDGGERQRQRNIAAPVIGILPAENVRVLGEDMFGTGTLALKPSSSGQQMWLEEYFADSTSPARKAEMRAQAPVLAAMVLEKLPQKDQYSRSASFSDVDANYSTDLYRLNPRMVHRTTMPKGAWSYPRPPLTRNFPLLEAKRLLNLMDYAFLQGGSNFLVIAKKGDKDKPAKQEEVDNLHGTLARASRTGVIIGDHRLSIEIVTPDLSEVLNSDKRRLIGRKLANAMLRVPEGDEDDGGEAVKARTEIVQRVLESDRRLLKRHVERFVYEEVARRNSSIADQAAKIWFPKIILQGTQYFTDYALKLRDRADISRSTAVAVAGFDWDSEVRKRKTEKPDDRVMTPPPVPFSGPNQGPQDNQPGRPPGSSPNNGRNSPSSPPASARPRQVVNRNAGETVTARFTDELGSYRIGALTEALFEEYEDTHEFGRVTAFERDAIARIEGGETGVLQSGTTTVIPVNVGETLDEIRAVRLSRGLGALVGSRRDDDAYMLRALSFREPEYDQLAAQELALKLGFEFDDPEVGDETAAAAAPGGPPLELHVHTAEGSRGKRVERDPETGAIVAIHDIEDDVDG